MLLFSTQNIVITIDLLLCICYTETYWSRFCLTNNSEQSLWSVSPYQYFQVCQLYVICKYLIAFMCFSSLRYWELSVYYSTVNARNILFYDDSPSTIAFCHQCLYIFKSIKLMLHGCCIYYFFNQTVVQHSDECRGSACIMSVSIMSLHAVNEIPSKEITFVWQDLFL